MKYLVYLVVALARMIIVCAIWPVIEYAFWFVGVFVRAGFRGLRKCLGLGASRVTNSLASKSRH